MTATKQSFLIKVYVRLKDSILDPQGQAALHALHRLGHEEIQDVRVGRYIEVLMSARSKEEAENKAKSYCDALLANPIIERYKLAIEQQGKQGDPAC